MVSLLTKGFNQKLINFNSHKNLFTCSRFPLRAVDAMSSPSTTHVFSPGFSTSSPINAPLKRVGTHNDNLYCDEALGCFRIRLTDKFSNAQIICTRDLKGLDKLDTVLDVRGVYDPSNDRYDHHQKGFEEIFGHVFSTKFGSTLWKPTSDNSVSLQWWQGIHEIH
ncbi:hypothetical protein LWI28_023714 [Acer negundo]|uniref:Uncharacterized protein n=1 Tax=Acer negundo TaxID=4023 RepID=A0AAD5J1T2_ACENE|nr:hypothetical protein LWI28_023714 [Acer negundo]